MSAILDTHMYSDPRRLSGGGEEHLGDDLLYLFFFWIIAYVSSILAKLTKLSPLLFYLLFGAILTNADIMKESKFLDILAEIAITIVFFALGFEENVANFLGGIKMSWGIASIGAIIPFGIGLLHAMFWFPEADIKSQLMCGLAVTATAVSLTMIALKSEGLAQSKASIGIMTAAVLDDVACLALVAVMVPVATGEAEATFAGVAWVLGKCGIFFAIIVFLNLIVFPHDLSEVPVLNHVPLVRSLGIHHLLRFDSGEQAVVVSLGVGLGTGLMATAFGFHPAIGAYMAGLILEERYFDLAPPMAGDLELGQSYAPTAAPNVYIHVREILENAAFCWIGPIFFIHLGSQIKMEVEIMKSVIPETLTLYIFLFVGQVVSASVAARFVPGGFTWTESLMIGFGMLGRAELFFVVLNICYIEHQIFTTEMFYSLTFAAMLMNVSVPVTISLYKPYYVGDKVCCGRRKESNDEQTSTQMISSFSGRDRANSKESAGGAGAREPILRFDNLDAFLTCKEAMKHRSPISLSEFGFFEEVKQDSSLGWKDVVNKPGVVVQQKINNNYSHALVRCFVEYDDLSPLVALYNIVDLSARTSWDTMFKDFHVVEAGDEGKDVVYYTVPSAARFVAASARDFVSHRRVLAERTTEGESYFVLQRSTTRTSVPQKSGFVRGENILSGYSIYRAAGSKKTVIFVTTMVDPKGMITAGMANSVAPKKCLQWVESWHQASVIAEPKIDVQMLSEWVCKYEAATAQAQAQVDRRAGTK